MDWEDILQEEERRRSRENEEGEEEEESMVFGGLDDEEAEVVRQPARASGILDGKDDDEESVTQEEEAGWERMGAAQGARHWESNVMKRIARENWRGLLREEWLKGARPSPKDHSPKERLRST